MTDLSMALIEMEAFEQIGASRYERTPVRRTQRNGYRERGVDSLWLANKLPAARVPNSKGPVAVSPRDPVIQIWFSSAAVAPPGATTPAGTILDQPAVRSCPEAAAAASWAQPRARNPGN